ncbi:cobalt transporter [Conservatibacter flavescens]|uniref:Nickel/cobalt efflux system n=2 Tax=Conservatibacter flavescens TaxID=28161 RepID=A0A2M8S639_9PAST|nr:cobalt transporter [Conservatibacter flavescens]
MSNLKQLSHILLLIVLILCIVYLFPWLFTQVAVWQKYINQLMSGYLHQLKENNSAGFWLMGISFAYGVFHALGPGHGKFIIASYLSTHQTQLKIGMRLTFLSSLTQGMVAILATSILVAGLNLSSAYFKLSQLWLERAAFGLLMLLGLYWCWQSMRVWWRKRNQIKKRLKIKKISLNSPAFSHAQPSQSAVKNPQVFHQHGADCGCGHQHIPTKSQLAQVQDWKSQCLVILSIGLRPCTGAVFILFLSYMLDLYLWGIGATLLMSLGTGMTLSGFALLVQYARKVAVNLGQWYLHSTVDQKYQGMGKFLAGIVLIFFAASLLYGTTLPLSGGAALFAR